MEDFVAKPSPIRLGGLALLSLGFVALGAWFLGYFGPEHPNAPAWVGWASIGFFGLGFLVMIARMFSKEDMVRIGAGGIWIRGVARGQAIPWSEIAAIGVWEHKRQKIIMLKLHDPDMFPTEGFGAMIASANRAMTGADHAISLTGTNRTFEEAMAAIGRYWDLEGNS